MATGGSFTRRCVSCTNGDQEDQQNASAEAMDSVSIKYPCNPCTSKENTTMTEAQYYCPTCEEYYCEECVTFHRRMALLRDHTVYGKSDMGKWGQRTTSSKLKEKCVKHPTESITMVCLRCNELCCHVCISIIHSKCNLKEYIPTAAKNILQSSRKQDITNKIQKRIKKASQLKEKLNNSLELVYTKQMISLGQITDMRKQADDIFNEMERRVTSLANTLRGNISEDIVTCNDLRLEMCSMKEELQNSDNKDECDVFMDVVKAENQATRTGKQINEIHVDKSESLLPGVEQFESTPDTDFYQILQQSKGVGQVSCSFPFKKLGLFKKCEDCHLEGYVEGICQTRDGSFILIDSANFCLVLLSTSYKLKNTIGLSEAPSAVCNTEPNHIAVSLNSKLHVFLIDTDITRVPTRNLTFNHRTCGLAYCDRKYYISDHAFTIYVYGMNGVCKKEIKPYVRGPLFQSVRNIAIGKETKTIYVTDIDKGLITMDLDGNVLSALETNDTKGAYGVCVTSTGTVLVTNYLLDKVIEVDEYGTTVLNTRLYTLTKGQSPRAICFDTQTTNVLVSENHLAGSGMITVFCS